jgi:transcriptional regulator with XRE-family HTH domain
VKAVDPKVGRRIRELRLEKGLSQRRVSRLAHAGRPSLSALIEIASKLGTTGLYLLTGRHDARCPFCGRH